MRLRPLLVVTIAAVGFLSSCTPPLFPAPTHPGTVSTNPNDVTPHVLDGEVKAVVEVGSKVIVGGRFTQVKKWNNPTVFDRVGIFAYDKATGTIDTAFAPVVGGGTREVRTLAAVPGTNTVLVGGTFQTVNGGPFVGGIVKLDAGNGQAVSQFQGLTDGWVFDMALVGNKLYLGGTFTKLKNVARVRLGALDATTGALDPSLDLPVTDALENAPYVWDLDVNPSGTRMVAVGNFATVGGQSRRQVAVIDLSTNPATLSTWQTNRYDDVCFHNWYVRDVDISPDGTYFVVVTTGAWRGTSTLCDTAARWEIASTGPGQQPTWVDYTGGDTLTAVTITGPVVYVAGHQRWQNNALAPQGDTAGPGAVPRTGIAALDADNGTVLTWDANRERGIHVWTLTPTSAGLYIGSDSQHIGGEFHPRLAFLPTSGGQPVPKGVVAKLPTNVFHATSTDGRLTGRSYDGSTFGQPFLVSGQEGVDWSVVRGVVPATDRIYRALADGTLQVSVNGGPFVASSSWIQFTGLSGLTYGQGRLLYTIAGDPRLYSRGFASESGVVNTLLTDATADQDWRTAVGLVAIGDRLYSARSDGNLYRTNLFRGRAVPGTTVAVSGPATGDGLDWSTTRALHAGS